MSVADNCFYVTFYANSKDSKDTVASDVNLNNQKLLALDKKYLLLLFKIVSIYSFSTNGTLLNLKVKLSRGEVRNDA